MIYLVSITGYEEYFPVYFKCSCSKEEFKEEVAKAISRATEQLKDHDGFITGHEMMGELIPILSKKFEYIKKDYEVDIDGECLYSDRQDKPEVFADDDWKKIVEHNDKIQAELHESKNDGEIK